MDLDEILRLPPYSLSAADKRRILGAGLADLTRSHRRRCPQYARLLDIFYPGLEDFRLPQEAPYLPVGLFKARELKSIPDSQVYKILTSSGTSGSGLSRIVLDRETARRQAQALGAIVAQAVGPARLPMLVLDSADFLKDRKNFNARAAAILGFSTFGLDHLYAFDSSLSADLPAIEAWLRAHDGPILVFGMTFLVWRLLEQTAGRLDLSRAVLIHGGGWKRLQERAVTRLEFRKALADGWGARRVYDYYGMVEQVGGVFLECEHGWLHAPNFSDILVRDPLTWKPARAGETGVIEAMSLLPESYPGHCVLTEDLGALGGEDGCSCGRRGTYFSVSGRVPQAQLRGCSDVYAEGAAA